jgi:tetratricopeptide (TPR) repeat protein
LFYQFFIPNNGNNNNYLNILLDEDKHQSENIHYKKAIKDYSEHNIRIAIDELNEEVKLYPKHAQAYFLLGKIYEDTEFPEGKYLSLMVKFYEKYIGLKPAGKRVKYAKLRVAQYYIQAGFKQRNVDLLKRAEDYLLSLDQTDSSVRMALGAIYLDKNNYDKAIEEFEKSAQLPPNDFKLKYNSLGLAYIKKESYAKAKLYLEIALKIDPNDKYAHNNIGYVYVRLNDYENAKKHFTEALKIDKTYTNAQDNLIWVEEKMRTASGKSGNKAGKD